MGIRDNLMDQYKSWSWKRDWTTVGNTPTPKPAVRGAMRAMYPDEIPLAFRAYSFPEKQALLRMPKFATGTKAVWGLNKAVFKANLKVARMGYRGANVLSKGLLHASIPQIGAAGAIVGLGAYMLGSSLGVTSDQVSGAASMFHETLKESGRKHYGYSELGQSTQGLVFGLNSRRTAG